MVEVRRSTTRMWIHSRTMTRRSTAKEKLEEQVEAIRIGKAASSEFVEKQRALNKEFMDVFEETSARHSEDRNVHSGTA